MKEKEGKAIRRMICGKFGEISDSIEKQKEERWSSFTNELQMDC